MEQDTSLIKSYSKAIAQLALSGLTAIEAEEVIRKAIITHKEQQKSLKENIEALMRNDKIKMNTDAIINRGVVPNGFYNGNIKRK